ncbi:MAG TPA: ClpX C4-type zinc finger protein [Polyangia bacterium]|nr:ClpX C4-type zinc finger protein [Polyangia bacterium]
MPACSLCGAPQSESLVLVSGREGRLICDRCLEDAQRIVSAAGEGVGLKAPDVAGVACSFCAKGSADVEHIVGDGKVFVCNECLDLCDDIVAEKLAASWRRAPMFALRESSGPVKIAETLREVRQELARVGMCAVTILFEQDRDRASALYRRIRATLADLAEVWEPPSPSPERALAIVACRRRTTESPRRE